MKEFSYRKILSITGPLMFGTFIQSIVTFTDAIFISELGEISIGAFGNGSLMYIAFFMFCRGLSDGAQIMIARYEGEKNYPLIGETVFHTKVYQLLISAIIFSIILIFGQSIIYGIANSNLIAAEMYDFIRFRGIGLFFAAQYLTLVAFLIGIGRTNLILISAVIIAITNIFLDYVLVFGHFGFPELKLIGAPIASSIAEIVGFIVLYVAIKYAKNFNKYAIFVKHKLNYKKYIPLLQLSIPLMFQGVLSLSTWLVFFTLIEHKGTAELEASLNIKYIYFLAFVPIFGFAASTKTIISNLVGQGKQHLIIKAQFKIILLSVIFILFFFHGAVLYPEVLVRMVNQNPNIGENTLNNSVEILKFVSGSILLYSVVVVLYNTIAGLGKTRISFWIEAMGILCYLTACYLFIVRWDWNIRDVWTVEYVYFSSLGLFSIIYLIYYKFKKLNYET
ncbi:MATE family efflux transporter [Crocinitomix catalasitica]|uniref:MATE family efflux transporter n=1 Tax=Crocinitomix catalasitica TaxID=184607 RepID=UPI000A02E9F0|nr:MATE family efflux transporter [Crocinitomix catalasitica]